MVSRDPYAVASYSYQKIHRRFVKVTRKAHRLGGPGGLGRPWAVSDLDKQALAGVKTLKSNRDFDDLFF